MADVLQTLIAKLTRRENLSENEAREAMSAILTFDDTKLEQVEMISLMCKISAFLALLRAKGETEDELFGMVECLRERLQSIQIEKPCIDIVGTGGDGHDTFNISTTSSIMAAACGISVAKTGNRSMTSMCGAADVLERLGVNIELPLEKSQKCLERTGLTFLYSPTYFPELKSIRQIRRSLGVPSILNILGPLLNPSNAEHHMIGVFDESLIEVIAKTLVKMKVKRSIVYCSENGMDELSPASNASMTIVEADGSMEYYMFVPENFGFQKCTVEDLKGGDAEFNANITRRVLEGNAEGTEYEPHFKTVAINTGVALWVYYDSDSISDGIRAALEKMRLGLGMKKLNAWIYVSQCLMEKDDVDETEIENNENAVNTKYEEINQIGNEKE